MATRIPAPADSRPTTVEVCIPAVGDGAGSGWRRLVTGVDPEKSGSFALEGPWPQAGETYKISTGAMIVLCDQYPGHRQVQLLRVEADGLTQVKAWQRKSALGPAVLNFLRSRLAQDAAGHTMVRTSLEPNQRTARCVRCDATVGPGKGRVERGDGRYWITHLNGQCPPAPPTTGSNERDGLCDLCQGWVTAGEGVTAIVDPAATVKTARYRVRHAPQCPAEPLPGPENREADWCVECENLVPAGQGYALAPRGVEGRGQRGRRWEVRHRQQCPEPAAEPMWVLRLRRKQPTLRVGQAARVQIDLRPGERVMAEVPRTTAGYRQLAQDYVQIVAVVVETATVRGVRHARVRAATYPEAADVLAAELQRVPDVRPEVAGFKARHTVERIGYRKPWLAEIQGRDADFDYVRDFLTADTDYTNANSRGTSGVTYSWTLAVNRIYQVSYHTGSIRSATEKRTFLRATADGDVVEIEADEVESWLDAAPVWVAT